MNMKKTLAFTFASAVFAFAQAPATPAAAPAQPAQPAEQAAPAQPAAEADKKDYRVIVKDESGAPVEGARVQFCDDVTCMFSKTDETGTASFAAEQGQYTVHIQKAPEGYAACTEEFAVAQDTHEVQIVLKKA